MHAVVSYSNAYLLIQNLSDIIYQLGKLKFQARFYHIRFEIVQQKKDDWHTGKHCGVCSAGLQEGLTIASMYFGGF
jgi:hypothetical protein